MESSKEHTQINRNSMTADTTSIDLPTAIPTLKKRCARRAGRIVRTLGALAIAAAATVLPAVPTFAQTVPTTPVEQRLFAGSLWATMAIENAAGFTTPGFDGNIFSLSGPFAKTKGNVIRFHNFQSTTLTSIQSASIEVQLTHSGWTDDLVALEYTVDAWRTTHQLASFSSANKIPSSLTAMRFDGLRAVISTPEQARSVEVRLRNVSATGKVEVVSFRLDQVALVVSGS